MRYFAAGIVLAALALGAGSAMAGTRITKNDHKLVKPILPSLKSKTPRKRLNAVLRLGKLGRRGRSAVPALLEVARDKNLTVGAAAFYALAQVGPDDARVLAALSGALSDTRWQVRASAAKGLALLGPRAKTAAAALITALADRNIEVRCRAIAALGNIGAASPLTVPALRTALKETGVKDAWRVRQAAAAALGAIGPRASDSTDALGRAVDDAHGGVRTAALGALRRIGRDAVPTFEDLLNHHKAKVRRAAVSELVKVRPKPRRALGRALIHKNADVRKAVAFAMGLRGDKLKAAMAAARKAKEEAERPAPEVSVDDDDEAPTPKEDAAAKQCRAWLSLARNFAANKMPAKARQQLMKIKEKHPGTEWAKQADEMLAKLAAAPVKKKEKK